MFLSEKKIRKFSPSPTLQHKTTEFRWQKMHMGIKQMSILPLWSKYTGCFVFFPFFYFLYVLYPYWRRYRLYLETWHLWVIYNVIYRFTWTSSINQSINRSHGVATTVGLGRPILCNTSRLARLSKPLRPTLLTNGIIFSQEKPFRFSLVNLSILRVTFHHRLMTSLNCAIRLATLPGFIILQISCGFFAFSQRFCPRKLSRFYCSQILQYFFSHNFFVSTYGISFHIFTSETTGGAGFVVLIRTFPTTPQQSQTSVPTMSWDTAVILSNRLLWGLAAVFPCTEVSSLLCLFPWDLRTNWFLGQITRRRWLLQITVLDFRDFAPQNVLQPHPGN